MPFTCQQHPLIRSVLARSRRRAGRGVRGRQGHGQAGRALRRRLLCQRARRRPGLPRRALLPAACTCAVPRRGRGCYRSGYTEAPVQPLCGQAQRGRSASLAAHAVCISLTLEDVLCAMPPILHVRMVQQALVTLVVTLYSNWQTACCVLTMLVLHVQATVAFACTLVYAPGLTFATHKPVLTSRAATSRGPCACGRVSLRRLGRR